MGYLGLLFLAVVCGFYVRRAQWRWRNRGKKNPGRYRGGAALGNALQNMQAFVQPRAEHMIVEMLKEPADEDDEAAPKDPRAHLLRQARRIQRGEPVERLTARLPE
jgi:hypothetical protein